MNLAYASYGQGGLKLEINIPPQHIESKGVTVSSVVSSNVSKPNHFEKVSGARKVWGTMRETTVKAVTGVISKLCPPTIEFKTSIPQYTGHPLYLIREHSRI